MTFATKHLSAHADVIAPDQSEVRLLTSCAGGSMAHFSLAPGKTSIAVAHRTVAELWYFTSGTGEMWRKLGPQEEVISVSQGVSISIPVGTHFQFRCTGASPLQAVGVTMPPWPGADEAYTVQGKW